MQKEQLIAAFIKANKLQPVTHEALRVDAHPIAASLVAGGKQAITVDYILNIRGGRRTPHLHYRGELYILDAKQWQAFSAPHMQEFSKKIAGANSIGFEHFMEIGESFSALGHL